MKERKGQNLCFQIDDGVMDDEQHKIAVDLTNGFSGREIGKLMIAMQGAVYASSDGKLTAANARNIIENKVSEHKDKREMIGSNVLSSVYYNGRTKTTQTFVFC